MIEIASIQYVSIDGNTFVYLESVDGKVLRQKFSDNEQLITLRVGEQIRVTARQNEKGTYFMTDFTKQMPR